MQMHKHATRNQSTLLQFQTISILSPPSITAYSVHGIGKPGISPSSRKGTRHGNPGWDASCPEDTIPH